MQSLSTETIDPLTRKSSQSLKIIAMQSLSTEIIDPSARKSSQSLKSKWSYVFDLRYLVGLLIFAILQNTVNPSVPYMINTFFAERYGGGDCEATPKSGPCQKGAVDAAFYHGLSDAAAHIMAMFLAMPLGKCSDSIGRLPVMRTYNVLLLLPLVALTSYIVGGITLWFYLVLAPAVEAFDVNGVFLAIMSDIVQTPEDRAAAFGIFIGVLMIVVGIVGPCGFLLPQKYTLVVSLVAAFLKLVYIFMVFPETAPKAVASSAQHSSFIDVVRQASRILTRNAFILRMALVLALVSLAGGGFAIVMPPFMTGYLGFTRRDKLIMMICAILSALVGFLGLLNPLITRFGSVRVLQMSLTSFIMFALVSPACTYKWHMWILTVLSFGPMLLALPVVTAIKSNLVRQSEQGLLQGSIASISKGATTLGFMLNGLVIKAATHSGSNVSQSSVFLPFCVIASIACMSLLVACSLPLDPPSPPSDDDAGDHEMVVSSPARFGGA